jgi:polysaccharide export outer membrane protein
MKLRTKFWVWVAVALATCTATLPQQPVQENTPATGRLPHYILGPNDEISILSLHAEEIANKPIRITTSGDINLLMIGRIHVAGMTLEALEAEVTERLKAYIRQPDVTINVTQFRSQPVSVFGAVGTPGVVQLEGRKTLIEVLSMAGGLKPEAGSRIRVTRKSEWGPIPLPAVVTEGDYSVAEVNIRSVEDATRPEDNIAILPNDVITVSRAEMVYVMGEVKKPGGFPLNDKRTISIIEALARAEGPGPTAKVKDSKIIREVADSNRIEIAVNLQDVLHGKAKDVMLQPNDILYVPTSYAKSTARRTLDTVIQMTTGAVIYRY